jgi:ribosomal protein S18 acetylase RimI-like enzyme
MFYKKKKYKVSIRKATLTEDSLIARHFYQLWLDNEIAPSVIHSNWLEETVQFITQARQNLAYQAFVAVIDNQIVGSSSCQLFAGLYPNPFEPSFRSYGYIWNVYVDADYRRQGIATKLTKASVNHLHSLDCTHAILHASPLGKSLYESLGFVPKNEMVLKLN